MRFFKVGGYVRDHLLGVRSQDVDYVVTGATEDELMTKPPFGIKSFSKVGAEFPVYLSDQGDEWALSRRERKNGEGYHGFEVEFGPEVTIEEDCCRRDFTMNAIAIEIFDDMKTRVLEYIDPYNGINDIKNKIIRHTSDAFIDDPVRVLRAARFMARFGPEWKIANETKELIYSMGRKGVLNELTPERIWKELSRALMEPHPRLFFDTLLSCDVLHILFPEVYKLKSALEWIRHHPEENSYEHTMLVLTRAAHHNFDLQTRYSCLVHDFGKILTPPSEMPKHYGHDVKGVPLVRDFSNRLTVPAKIRDNAMFATRYHMFGHRLSETTSKTFVKMFDEMNIKNNKEIVKVLYEVFVCDEQGRLGSENNDVEKMKAFLDKANRYAEVKFSDVFPDGETNVNKIKEGLKKARIHAVSKTT